MIKLEDYFKYHPPLTQERVEEHDRVNKAAMEFALTLQDLNFKDEDFQIILHHIQFARMMANLFITFKHLKQD